VGFDDGCGLPCKEREEVESFDCYSSAHILLSYNYKAEPTTRMIDSGHAKKKKRMQKKLVPLKGFPAGRKLKSESSFLNPFPSINSV
jgi:hypothetical protein